MKLNSLGKTWEMALRNNTGLLISNVVLSVLLFVSVTANLSDHERIVLTPPHMEKQMEVAWHTASGDYLKSWGLYVATLIGNITPKNVNLVADAMGGFLDPSIYPQVRAQIKSLADDPVFQRANAINYFAPEQAVYEVDSEKRQKVFVSGQLVTSSFEGLQQGARSSDLRWVVYEMSLVMRDGRPVITDFTSYPGNQPHTQKWLQAQQGGQVKPQKKESEQ